MGLGSGMEGWGGGGEEDSLGSGLAMERKVMINKGEEVKVEQQRVGGSFLSQTAPLSFLPCLVGPICSVVSDY